MRSFSSRHPEAGFSLIVMALVLAGLGLLLAAYLHWWQIENEKQKIETTRARMTAIHVALTRYVAQKERLPCPADPTVSERAETRFDDTGGQDETCAPDDPLHPNANSPKNPVWSGVVPLRALHLNPQFAVDGWGNMISYFVTRDLTAPHTLGAKPQHGVMRVLNEEGRNVMKRADRGDYVLVSHGPTGMGAWTPAGVRKPCVQGTLDAQNCDGDAVFIKMGFSSVPGPRFYDDIVVTDDLKDRTTIEKIAVCNSRMQFFSESGGDTDGCVGRRGVWKGGCTLSYADPQNGLKTNPVPKVVFAPASKVAGGDVSELVKHGLLPPAGDPPGACTCPADFQTFQTGPWDDHHITPSYAHDSGSHLPPYPAVCWTDSMNGMFKTPDGKPVPPGLVTAVPPSWCQPTYWIKTALYSCSPHP